MDCKRQEVHSRPSEGMDRTAGSGEWSLWTPEGREQGGSKKELKKTRVGPEKRDIEKEKRYQKVKREVEQEKGDEPDTQENTTARLRKGNSGLCHNGNIQPYLSQ